MNNILICPICEDEQKTPKLSIRDDGRFYECKICGATERSYYWEMFKELKKLKDRIDTVIKFKKKDKGNIAAIKLYRGIYGASLLESKRFVEAIN